jgi:hypothetical protein
LVSALAGASSSLSYGVSTKYKYKELSRGFINAPSSSSKTSTTIAPSKPVNSNQKSNSQTPNPTNPPIPQPTERKMVQLTLLFTAGLAALTGLVAAESCKDGLNYCGYNLLHKGEPKTQKEREIPSHPSPF